MSVYTMELQVLKACKMAHSEETIETSSLLEDPATRCIKSDQMKKSGRFIKVRDALGHSGRVALFFMNTLVHRATVCALGCVAGFRNTPCRPVRPNSTTLSLCSQNQLYSFLSNRVSNVFSKPAQPATVTQRKCRLPW